MSWLAAAHLPIRLNGRFSVWGMRTLCPFPANQLSLELPVSQTKVSELDYSVAAIGDLIGNGRLPIIMGSAAHEFDRRRYGPIGPGIRISPSHATTMTEIIGMATEKMT